MWTVKEAEETLKKMCPNYIEGQNVNLENLVVELAAFYYDNNIKRYKKEDDGDMILVEHGIFDFGKGKHFQWSYTRQFYKSTNIRQLHLNLFYDPTIEELINLGTGSFWNENAEKEDWINKVTSTAAYQVVKEQPLLDYEIILERV